MIVPAVQPIGHDSQIPTDPRNDEKTKARMTRRMRSENVEIMNGVISPVALRTASVITFVITTM